MLNLNVSKLNRITNSNKFYFMKTIRQANAFGFYKQMYRPPDSTRYVHYYYFSSVQHTIPPPSNIYEQNIVGDIVLLTSSKHSTTSTTRLSST
jgi:dTDP-D-glucose 4,6-dehydratase